MEETSKRVYLKNYQKEPPTVVQISKDDYEHPMVEIHKPKRVGKFEIIKKIIPKGQRERFILDGNVVQCEHLDDYPIIKLIEKRHGEKDLEDDGWTHNCYMTDTPYEVETNRKAIENARGDVLDLGLGIGYFSYHAKRKPEVKSVTIVEKQKEVIELIYPAIKDKKTKIIHDDARKFLRKNKKKYDMINIDFVGGMLPFDEMQQLRKLGEKHLKPDGIVILWQEDVWRKVKDRIKKGSMRSAGIGIYDPCIGCGKTMRHDYAGLCMDCADELGISELGFKI